MKRLFLFVLLFASICHAQVSLISDKLAYRETIADCNVTIGNPDVSAEFQSHVKMEFWGENYICLHEEGVKGTPTLKDENISLDLPERKLEWFKGDGAVGFGGISGVLHWVEILKEKPLSNKWSLKISDAGQFRYLYQKPLSEIANEVSGSVLEYLSSEGVDYVQLTYPNKADGVVRRPLEIEGSYAVYHNTKRDNYVGGKNYRTGKVLHIPRPKAVDAKGKWSWCSLHIEDGVYTRTIPQKFLDEAVYPVRINDTFGYNTVGGSDHGWQTGYIYAASASPASDGSATSVSLYLASGGAQDVTMGIYDEVSGDPDTLLKSTGGGQAVAQPDWTPQNLDSALAVLAANTYWIAATVSANMTGKFDADTGNGKHDAFTYDTGEMIADFNSDGAQNRVYSLYVTYTPSGASDAGQIIFINMN